MLYCSCPILQMQTCKSGNFHGALNSSGQHAGPLVACMCESHVELQGNEVCRPLVWMKRMSEGLEGMLFIIFCVCVWDCVLLLYCFCCCVSYSFSAVLLLCNLLFCRHQTLLSKDTNVCSVVMDMLGFQLQSLSPCCCVGVFLCWTAVFCYSLICINWLQVLLTCHLLVGFLFEKIFLLGLLSLLSSFFK